VCVCVTEQRRCELTLKQEVVWILWVCARAASAQEIRFSAASAQEIRFSAASAQELRFSAASSQELRFSVHTLYTVHQNKREYGYTFSKCENRSREGAAQHAEGIQTPVCAWVLWPYLRAGGHNSELVAIFQSWWP